MGQLGSGTNRQRSFFSWVKKFSVPPNIQRLPSKPFQQTKPSLPEGLLSGEETPLVPQCPGGSWMVSPLTQVHSRVLGLKIQTSLCMPVYAYTCEPPNNQKFPFAST